MNGETIISTEQLRELIRREKIRPDQLFEPEALKELTDAARAAGYAEARLASRPAADSPKPKPDEDKDEGKYLDPARNPYIKP